MTNSESAKKLNDLLKDLKDTDPEMVEIFGNFAFNDVPTRVYLDTRTRFMVILASLIAQQALGLYRDILALALDEGVTPVDVKEIVYHAVPYVGMAKALDFIYATNDVLTGRGVTLPLEPQSTTTSETRFEKGLAMSKSIFGNVIDMMYEKSPKNQIHFQEFISAACYGDYLTRSGLDVAMRELLTFAMLVSLGDCKPQLIAHINGNVTMGKTKEDLLAVVAHLLPYVGFPRTLNVLLCLNEILPEPRPRKSD